MSRYQVIRAFRAVTGMTPHAGNSTSASTSPGVDSQR
ncbi:hypothetical protein M8494_23360 [Serratia ureilytica]